MLGQLYKVLQCTNEVMYGPSLGFPCQMYCPLLLIMRKCQTRGNYVVCLNLCVYAEHRQIWPFQIVFEPLYFYRPHQRRPDHSLQPKIALRGWSLREFPSWSINLSQASIPSRPFYIITPLSTRKLRHTRTVQRTHCVFTKSPITIMLRCETWHECWSDTMHALCRQVWCTKEKHISETFIWAL